MCVETCTSAAVDQCFFRQPKQPDFLSPNLLLPQWQNPVFVLEECDTLTSDISNELAVRRVDDRLFRRDFRGFESTNLLDELQYVPSALSNGLLRHFAILHSLVHSTLCPPPCRPRHFKVQSSI